MDIKALLAGLSAGKASAPAGGGAELNIAYGDTAPEDTTKLWVKAEEPRGLLIGQDLTFFGAPGATGAGGGIEQLSLSIPSKRLNAATAAVGTKIFTFGGEDSNYQTSKAIYELDTEAKTVVTLSQQMTNGKITQICAAVGTSIFLMGSYDGMNSSKYVYEFDTVERKMTDLGAIFPINLGPSSGVAVGEKIYIFGGQTSSTGYTDAIYCFDTQTKETIKFADTLPQRMKTHYSAAFGTKIYVFGGSNSSGGQYSVYCFDTETEKLDELAESLPGHVGNWTSFATVGENVYLFGGGDYTTEIWRFDMVKQTFEELSAVLPLGLVQLESATVGNDVYLFGGKDSNSSTGLAYKMAVYRMTGDVPMESGLIAILQAKTGTIFPIIDTETARLEIGISSVLRGNEENVAEEVEAATYKDGEWVTI